MLQFCSDENQQNIQNLSGAVEKPATNVMSLWSGMIVSCYSLPESESDADLIVPTNMATWVMLFHKMMSTQVRKRLPKASSES